MDLNKTPGLLGEKLAEKYLRRQGYRILDRRCRTKFGELDLVCRKKKELVFVEVRSRERNSGLEAEESILGRKREHLVKSARAWLLKRGLRDLSIRFDVITVDLSENPPVINHYPYAFESEIDL